MATQAMGAGVYVQFVATTTSDNQRVEETSDQVYKETTGKHYRDVSTHSRKDSLCQLWEHSRLQVDNQSCIKLLIYTKTSTTAFWNHIWAP